MPFAPHAAKEHGRTAYLICGLLVLLDASRPMITEAKAAGQYKHETMGRTYDRISIVTVREIVEGGNRLDIPMSLEVLRAAARSAESGQIDLI